jgi:hypothetical protein
MFDTPVPWSLLEAAQWKNLHDDFNPKLTASQKKANYKAEEKYKEILKLVISKRDKNPGVAPSGVMHSWDSS